MTRAQREQEGRVNLLEKTKRFAKAMTTLRTSAQGWESLLSDNQTYQDPAKALEWLAQIDSQMGRIQQTDVDQLYADQGYMFHANFGYDQLGKTQNASADAIRDLIAAVGSHNVIIDGRVSDRAGKEKNNTNEFAVYVKDYRL